MKVATTKTKRRRISSSSEEESRNDAPVKREKSCEDVRAAVEKMEVDKTPVVKNKTIKTAKQEKVPSPKAKKTETSPKVKKEATTPKSSPKAAKTAEDETVTKRDKTPEKESSKDPEEKSPENEKPKPINPFARTVKIQNAGQGLAGADYDPSAKKYDPIKNAFWKRGEK